MDTISEDEEEDDDAPGAGDDPDEHDAHPTGSMAEKMAQMVRGIGGRTPPSQPQSFPTGQDSESNDRNGSGSFDSSGMVDDLNEYDLDDTEEEEPMMPIPIIPRLIEAIEEGSRIAIESLQNSYVEHGDPIRALEELMPHIHRHIEEQQQELDLKFEPRIRVPLPPEWFAIQSHSKQRHEPHDDDEIWARIGLPERDIPCLNLVVADHLSLPLPVYEVIVGTDKNLPRDWKITGKLAQGQKTYYVYQFALELASFYFPDVLRVPAMLRNCQSTRNKMRPNVIELPDVDTEMFGFLLEYLYTEKITNRKFPDLDSLPTSTMMEYSIKLWLLGENLEIPALMDYATWCIVTIIESYEDYRMLKTWWKAIIGACNEDTLLWDAMVDYFAWEPTLKDVYPEYLHWLHSRNDSRRENTISEEGEKYTVLDGDEWLLSTTVDGVWETTLHIFGQHVSRAHRERREIEASSDALEEDFSHCPLWYIYTYYEIELEDPYLPHEDYRRPIVHPSNPNASFAEKVFRLRHSRETDRPIDRYNHDKAHYLQRRMMAQSQGFDFDEPAPELPLMDEDELNAAASEQMQNEPAPEVPPVVKDEMKMALVTQMEEDKAGSEEWWRKAREKYRIDDEERKARYLKEGKDEWGRWPDELKNDEVYKKLQQQQMSQKQLAKNAFAKLAKAWHNVRERRPQDKDRGEIERQIMQAMKTSKRKLKEAEKQGSVAVELFKKMDPGIESYEALLAGKKPEEIHWFTPPYEQLPRNPDGSIKVNIGGIYWVKQAAMRRIADEQDARDAAHAKALLAATAPLERAPCCAGPGPCTKKIHPDSIACTLDAQGNPVRPPVPPPPQDTQMGELWEERIIWEKHRKYQKQQDGLAEHFKVNPKCAAAYARNEPHNPAECAVPSAGSGLWNSSALPAGAPQYSDNDQQAIQQAWKEHFKVNPVCLAVYKRKEPHSKSLCDVRSAGWHLFPSARKRREITWSVPVASQAPSTTPRIPPGGTPSGTSRAPWAPAAGTPVAPWVKAAAATPASPAATPIASPAAMASAMGRPPALTVKRDPAAMAAALGRPPAPSSARARAPPGPSPLNSFITSPADDAGTSSRAGNGGGLAEGGEKHAEAPPVKPPTPNAGPAAKTVSRPTPPTSSAAPIKTAQTPPVAEPAAVAPNPWGKVQDQPWATSAPVASTAKDKGKGRAESVTQAPPIPSAASTTQSSPSPPTATSADSALATITAKLSEMGEAKRGGPGEGEAISTGASTPTPLATTTPGNAAANRDHFQSLSSFAAKVSDEMGPPVGGGGGKGKGALASTPLASKVPGTATTKGKTPTSPVADATAQKLAAPAAQSPSVAAKPAPATPVAKKEEFQSVSSFAAKTSEEMGLPNAGGTGKGKGKGKAALTPTPSTSTAPGIAVTKGKIPTHPVADATAKKSPAPASQAKDKKEKSKATASDPPPARPRTPDPHTLEAIAAARAAPPILWGAPPPAPASKPATKTAAPSTQTAPAAQASSIAAKPASATAATKKEEFQSVSTFAAKISDEMGQPGGGGTGKGKGRDKAKAAPTISPPVTTSANPLRPRTPDPHTLEAIAAARAAPPIHWGAPPPPPTSKAAVRAAPTTQAPPTAAVAAAPPPLGSKKVAEAKALDLKGSDKPVPAAAPMGLFNLPPPSGLFAMGPPRVESAGGGGEEVDFNAFKPSVPVAFPGAGGSGSADDRGGGGGGGGGDGSWRGGGGPGGRGRGKSRGRGKKR